MRPSWDEAKALQRSLPDGALTIATGEKEDELDLAQKAEATFGVTY